MMVFTKNSGSGQFSAASKLLFGPYDTLQAAEQIEIEIAISGPATELVANVSPFSRTSAILRNTSPGSQLVRFCGGTILPSFSAPVVGQLLKPDEVVSLENVSLPIIAIADTAGALVSRFVVRSSGPPII